MIADTCWICKKTESEVLKFLLPFLNTIPEKPEDEKWNEYMQVGRQKVIESIKHKEVECTSNTYAKNPKPNFPLDKTFLKYPVTLCYICRGIMYSIANDTCSSF